MLLKMTENVIVTSLRHYILHFWYIFEPLRPELLRMVTLLHLINAAIN